MPPSFDIAIAKSTSTTPSMAEPQKGTSRRSPPSSKRMSTSSGLIVTPPGTRATSSNPYALRARRPIPISRPASLLTATEFRVCLLLWRGGVSRKYTGTLLADAAKDSGVHPRYHGRRVPPTPRARDPAHQPPAPRRHARDRPQAAPAPDGDLARPPARVRPPVRAAGDLGHGALPA